MGPAFRYTVCFPAMAGFAGRTEQCESPFDAIPPLRPRHVTGRLVGSGEVVRGGQCVRVVRPEPLIGPSVDLFVVGDRWSDQSRIAE